VAKTAAASSGPDIHLLTDSLTNFVVERQLDYTNAAKHRNRRTALSTTERQQISCRAKDAPNRGTASLGGATARLQWFECCAGSTRTGHRGTAQR
jgi:hypothetical protein